MELPNDSFLPEMSLAIQAALASGAAVLGVYGGEFSHTLKPGLEPVTEADTLSDKIIREILAASGYAMLSEESPDTGERLKGGRVWIVDPLDGTKDFINRTGEFSIMIALVEAGAPILGVVFRPDIDELYIAQAGQGAFQRQGGAWRAMRVSNVSDMAQARAVLSRNHLSRDVAEFIKTLGLTSFWQQGSCGLKVAAAAAGQADLHLTFTNKIKQWDTAAAYCIIKEAGGEMTDMSGNTLVYNTPDIYHKNGILVTNGQLHNQITALYKKNSAPKP